MQWIEWSDKASFVADQLLPETSVADFYIGSYTATLGTFFNPFSAGADNYVLQDLPVDTEGGFTKTSFAEFVSGSTGTVKYQPNVSGMGADTQITTDSWMVTSVYHDLKAIYSKYDQELDSFNTLAASYNKDFA